MVLRELAKRVEGHLEQSTIKSTIYYLYVDVAQYNNVVELKKSLKFKMYRVVRVADTYIIVVE